MMEINCCLFFFFFFFLLMGLSAPSSLISDDIFYDSQSHQPSSASASARNLLQAKKGCRVNFEFLNYTIITSQCKGPKYQPDPCCSSFKEFACPYAQEINDLTTDCASTMFSYINLYGKYPPGLFSSFCRGGKEGLECPDSDSPVSVGQDAASRAIRNSSPVVISFAAGFLLLLVRILRTVA